jgi:hypothetical protein
MALVERRVWRRVLLAVAIENLLGGLIFVITVGLVPSWIVYPAVLVVGCVRLSRGSGTAGVGLLTVAAVVFLLVHLPFTRFGPGGSGCAELGCNPVIAWIALTALPLGLAVAGAVAWHDLRPRLA